jgi:hypothetical protein
MKFRENRIKFRENNAAYGRRELDEKAFHIGYPIAIDMLVI